MERDPIVEELRRWINAGANGLAPTYPATDILDTRPPEVVPMLLKSLDIDVWPILQSAGLQRACAKVMHAYYRFTGVHLPAAALTL